MAVAVPPDKTVTLWSLMPQHPGPPVRLLVLVRSTVPEKLLKLVTVIVEVPDWVLVTFSRLGEEEMPKSGPATIVTVVVCCNELFVPITSTMYVPGTVEGASVTFIVEVAVSPANKGTGLGVKITEIPIGKILVERSTEPVNMLRLPTVTVEVWDEPSGIGSVDGLVLILKSPATTEVWTFMELDEVPLVPVTLTE